MPRRPVTLGWPARPGARARSGAAGPAPARRPRRWPRRGRCRSARRSGWRGSLGPRRPGVPLQRAEVGRPDQRGRLVDHQVGRGLARLGVRVVPARQPVRRVVGQLLVPEARAARRRRGSGACSAGGPPGRAGPPGRSGRRSGSGRAWSPASRRAGRGTAPCPGWSAAARGRTPPSCRRAPSASSAASSVGGGARDGRGAARPTPAPAAGPSARSGPGRPCTSSLVRPLSTDAGWSSGSQPLTAYSSCLCSSSHCSLPPRLASAPDQHEPAAQLLAVQVDVQLAGGDRAPPGRRCACGSQVPRVPDDHVAAAVLAGAGSRPRSRGTRSGGPRRGRPGASTAGSSVGPFGTAQLTSTPSISKRKS